MAVVTTSAALGGGSSSKTNKSSFKAALVSDVIGFNDAGFNRNQLKGLNKAVGKIGGTAIPEVSHATSDYAPNFNNAIRKGANIVVAAGFLLSGTEATYAKKFPKIKFAITDYSVHGAPFADKKGNVLPRTRTSRASPTRRTSRAASSACSRRRWRRSSAGTRSVRLVD